MHAIPQQAAVMPISFPNSSAASIIALRRSHSPRDSAQAVARVFLDIDDRFGLGQPPPLPRAPPSTQA
jgi:hypothetical protein